MSYKNTLNRIQGEVFGWSWANFHDQPVANTLLGVGEEIGEFLAAKSDEDAIDAICDALIFLMDFCGRSGISLCACIERCEATRCEMPVPGWSLFEKMVYCYGQMAHHRLKRDQRIRTNEYHHYMAGIFAGEFYLVCEEMLKQDFGADAEKEVERTWAEVSKRDWKANPEDGITR